MCLKKAELQLYNKQYPSPCPDETLTKRVPNICPPFMKLVDIEDSQVRRITQETRGMKWSGKIGPKALSNC